MRQRAVIAMMLACDPDVLICDEPTTALDVTIQAQIVELLQDIQAERDLAILFITHDMGVIAEISDRVNVMYAGEFVEKAPVEELFANPKHPYTQGLLDAIRERASTTSGSTPSRATCQRPTSPRPTAGSPPVSQGVRGLHRGSSDTRLGVRHPRPLDGVPAVPRGEIAHRARRTPPLAGPRRHARRCPGMSQQSIQSTADADQHSQPLVEVTDLKNTTATAAGSAARRSRPSTA